MARIFRPSSKGDRLSATGLFTGSSTTSTASTSLCRDGNWKLLADKTLEDVRLYDFADNRFEVVDVAPEKPDVVSELLVKLKSIRDSVARDPLSPRLNSR